jgi:hypothetical protein
MCGRARVGLRGVTRSTVKIASQKSLVERRLGSNPSGRERKKGQIFFFFCQSRRSTPRLGRPRRPSLLSSPLTSLRCGRPAAWRRPRCGRWGHGVKVQVGQPRWFAFFLFAPATSQAPRGPPSDQLSPSPPQSPALPLPVPWSSF